MVHLMLFKSPRWSDGWVTRVLSEEGFAHSEVEWSMDFRHRRYVHRQPCGLTGEEQKAVKTTAFDLQLNPAGPGMSFHKLDKARDKNFWSVRVRRRHSAYRP